MRTKIVFVSLVFYFLFLSSAFSANFKNYLELSSCVDEYKNFTGYKSKLNECFKNQGIELNKDSFKLIEKKSGIIDDIIELELPNQEVVVEKKSFLEKFKSFERNLNETLNPDLDKIAQEENIFNKPSVFSDNYNKEQNFNIDDKDFSKLNRHIKNNPIDIYALTEDINFLTFKKGYLSEFKRQELLLNIYNSFDPLLFSSLAKTKVFNGIAGSSQLGVLALVGGIAATGGGGGGGGGSSSPATLSFSVSASSLGECDSSGITITGSLTKAHSSNVTVTYSTSGTATNGTDYNLSSTTSTIVAGATSGSISLTPVNDTTNETSETVIVSASTSDISTTGNTSTTITIYDYVLKCNSTAYSEGSASSQNTIKNASTWTAIEAGGATHAYEQMGIHKVHSFTSGSTSLTGVGQTIHVADFNCDDNHDIYNNKTITNLDDGDPGESTFSAATASDNHCQGVAMFAAGDSNARTGVAPDADLVLSSIPDIQGSNEGDDYAADLDAARAAGAIASNQSWGYSDAGGSYNISELKTAISNNGWSAAEGLANLMHGSTSGQDLTDANTYVTALNNFEDSGVVVWAAANTTTESDANALGGLPEIFSDLGEAWLVANVVQYTGDDDLSDATSSEFTLKGNPCGSTAAYCLSVDGWDVYAATYVNSGTSMYNTSRISYGSSWSAPMVSGGVALMAQAFPNHTPEQLVDRILASANNIWFTPTGETTFTTHGASIKHGYHSTWGHGVPDFYAAMSPITTSKNPLSFGGGGSGGGGGGGSSGGQIPFSQLNKYPVHQTSLSLSSSLGNSISNSLENKFTYAYDALNGGFKIYLKNFIDNQNIDEQNINITVESEIKELNNFNSNIKSIYNNFKGEFFNFKNKFNYGSSITLDNPNIAIQNSLPKNNYYLNPFLSENNGLGFNQKMYFMGNDLFISYNNSKINPLTNINHDIILPLETLALSLDLNSELFEKLSLTTGLMKESNSFLLSKSSGAFEFENSNITNFYTVNLRKHFFKNSILSLNNTFGFSNFKNNYNNFIIGSSEVLSASFEIDYELNNIFGNDKLNFTLSQPNRVEKGDMKFRLLGLSNKNGIIPYQDHIINLSPNGRQKDLILSYYKNLTDDSKFGLKSIVTDDLGHIKDSKLRANFLATFSHNF